MDGFYSIWSKPLMDNNKAEYSMRDFDLLTFILSVNVWQRYNGNALLIADCHALNYLKGKNILSLFKGGYKELKIEDDIDTKMYWAGGKLYAMKMIDKPMCMVDLDLIVWKSMEEYAKDADILVIHREEVTEHIYPNPYLFATKDGYKLRPGLDLYERPCNTALLYVDDIDFLHSYAEEAIDFMKHSAFANDNLCHMVFAEQRLISMLAKEQGKTIKAMFPLATDIGLQDLFTHVWGHKNVLKYNYDERVRYCKKIINRLRYEYPESFELVKAMDEMKSYI